jgi:hypothetical protein
LIKKNIARLFSNIGTKDTKWQKKF